MLDPLLAQTTLSTEGARIVGAWFIEQVHVCVHELLAFLIGHHVLTFVAVRKNRQRKGNHK